MPKIQNLSEISNAVFDSDILRHSIGKIGVCKFCKKNNFLIYKPSFSKQSFTSLDNKVHYLSNIFQLLGGRIIGVGGHGLDLLYSTLGLPKTLSSAAFYPLQKSLVN